MPCTKVCRPDRWPCQVWPMEVAGVFGNKHNDPSFFCMGKECTKREARSNKVLSHCGRMGCRGDMKVQVLPEVRIPTRVVLPTVVPVLFEPKLMQPRPKASRSSING